MKKHFLIFFIFSIISFPQDNHYELPQCVDTSLCDIILRDTLSSRIVLGAENLVPYQKIPPFRFWFFNRQKTQILTCEFHPGDYLYSISEFKVEMNISDNAEFTIDSSEINYPILENISSFKTGKSIELGNRYENIIEILGKPHRTFEENGLDIIIYELNDVENSDFLRLYKSHVYYGHYKFRNDKLIEFEFGFHIP